MKKYFSTLASRPTLAFAALVLVLGAVEACAPAPAPTVPLPTATIASTLAPTVAEPTAAPATVTLAPTATTLPTLAPTATRTAISVVAGTDVPRPHVAMTRFEINKGKDPNAICNDGSTAVFFLQRGYGNGANKWIIFLKGGGACWDSASCTGRDKGLISSNGLSERDIDKDGITSDNPAQNPDFYSWNHIFVPYCSSDWFSGASPDNNNPMKFYFRGHYILDAVVDSLSDASMIGAPTLGDATQIVFSGSSAGGIGVRINLDRLAKTLSWADVRGVMDAEMFVPTNPAYTQAEQDQRGSAMMNLYKPILDESCQASAAARPWLCMGDAFDVVNKQVSTPMFVRHDLYDPINLEWQNLDPKKPQDRQFINAAAMKYSDILKSLPGALGTNTNDHIALETSKFNLDQVDGLTFAQVLGNWYFNRSGPKVVVAPVRR